MPERCTECQRFMTTRKSYGWWNYGEYGEEIGFVCDKCLPNWTPQAGNGRKDPRWCGIRHPTTEPTT